MQIVVFGLSITSSWGNGHATLWRGLARSLAERGHAVTFFERQVPWYAAHRDDASPAGATVVLYDDWPAREAQRAVDGADAAIVTSYCPDARRAAALRGGAALRVFYDLDTPVTFARLDSGQEVPYLPSEGLRDFDLVLSFTGGEALAAMRSRLGARRVAPLYGSADLEAYGPGRWTSAYAGALSYLGTYAADRRQALQTLFLDVARRRPADRFVLGGSLYPPDLVWPDNVAHRAHVAPQDHSDFYASSAWTLNVTRGAMKRMAFCPSGRLFEAAACGAAIASDRWTGIEAFFAPGVEVALVDTADDVEAMLGASAAVRRGIGEAARARVVAEHSSRHRAGQLEQLLAAARDGSIAVPAPRPGPGDGNEPPLARQA
jgi:spore maturation protein CgeB